MCKRYPSAIVLAAVTLLACTQCAKKSDPAVPNSIPANSAALKVNGVAYPVTMTNTAAAVNAKTGELRITIYGYSGRLNGPNVHFNVQEFQKRAETITLGTGSDSGLYIQGGQLPDGSVENGYNWQDCGAAQERHFEVTEVNQEAQTVSVKFSGTVCNGSEVKHITDGQVNLHYVLN